MLKVIRHRPVQACVIVALSALVTACAVFTPIYQRALDQASTQVELANAPPGAATLELTSTGIVATIYSGRIRPTPALAPDQLTELVPPSLRGSFGAPVNAYVLRVTMPDDAPQPSDGALIWRAGACDHLKLASGRCPSAEREILVSTADADNFGWGPGTQLPGMELLPSESLGPAAPTMAFTVTGVYRPPTDPYWAGWSVVGASGTRPDRKITYHDSWITGEATFGAPDAPWRNPTSQVDLRVDGKRTDVDRLLSLAPALVKLGREQERRPTDSGIVRIRSGLNAVADKVREARHQSRTTIPALMVPLGLLGLVVLWMALGAGSEQRRPEIAVARLRGRGVRGARAHVLRELLPTVWAGVPLGVAAALGLSWPARRLLPGDVALEVRPPVWTALALAVLAVTATAVLVSAGISREPIVALLRRVPARRAGWGLGTMDAVIVTVAASILGAFVTGRLTGPVALAAPAVLALAAGLVLARLLVRLATRTGRLLFTRGATGSGVAFLQLARRPGVRATIALLTVSAAILLFSADAVAVGNRNRDLAARQQVGAPMVATVSGGTVRSVREAVAEVDRGRKDLTTVVVQQPLSDDDQTKLFVERDAFLRMATFADAKAAHAALHRLDGPAVAPIKVVGHRLTVDIATESFYKQSHQSVSLALRLLGHDGVPVSVPLGPLSPGTSAPSERTVPIDCAAGCVLTGWQLLGDPGSSGDGRVIIGPVRTDDGKVVALGDQSDWTTGRSNGSRIQVQDAGPQSLTLFVANNGSSELTLTHSWVPATLKAAVSGSLPPGSEGTHFTGSGLDGVSRPIIAAARLPWLPTAGRNASLVDLDLALRSGMDLGDETSVQVWFAHEDRRALVALTKALEARHTQVGSVATVSEARKRLDDSAANWSMQLGVLVGLACLLVAALGLAIAGAASWRSRARDLAILRLNGMATRDVRRISIGEQLPVVVVSVLIGAGAGVLAAHYALPTLPILPTHPVIDIVDLSAAWGAVLLLTAVAVATLCVVGALIATLVARRASPDRVVGAP